MLFKLDYLLPTGSFKDRGAALLTEHFRAQGTRALIVDSSGNAAAAMAGYCAANGLALHVYAPVATTSPGKLVQARAFGATVHLVAGNREAVAAAAQDAAEQTARRRLCEPQLASGLRRRCQDLGARSQGTTWRAQPGGSLRPDRRRSAFVGGSVASTTTRALPARIGRRATGRLRASQLTPSSAATQTVAAVIPGATMAEGTRIGAPARGRQIMTAIHDTGGWASSQ